VAAKAALQSKPHQTARNRSLALMVVVPFDQ